MNTRRTPSDPERRMLARIAATIACRIAAGFLLALALLGFCTYRVVLAEQQSQARQQLTVALDDGSPATATPCLWLFVVEDGRVRGPAQAPPGFPLASALSDAPADGAPAQTSISVKGTVFDVLTVRSGGVERQAVFDTWYQQADLDHLIRALLLAGLIGVGAATVVGAAIGRRSIAPLADALARQRRFVADASHELRTPLTRLHTRAQLLLRRRPEQLSDELADELGALVRSAGELDDVVEDLLISAGLRSDPRRRERVDLAELAATAVEAERPRLEARSLVLANPGGPGQTAVFGAPSPLRRMILTLLDNAIAHTTPNGAIEVTVGPAEHGGVELRVADDGTGFDPADGGRIFERFAQSGRPGPRRFGLGLALAREIVADHGGTIRAASRPGQGATFTIRLPAARVPRAAGASAGSAPDGPGAP